MKINATNRSETNFPPVESPYRVIPPTIAVASHRASAVSTSRTKNLNMAPSIAAATLRRPVSADSKGNGGETEPGPRVHPRFTGE
nr:hypothetical protein GCM10025732_57350 [Glycomyces mayteni]